MRLNRLRTRQQVDAKPHFVRTTWPFWGHWYDETAGGPDRGSVMWLCVGLRCKGTGATMEEAHDAWLVSRRRFTNLFKRRSNWTP